METNLQKNQGISKMDNFIDMSAPFLSKILAGAMTPAKNFGIGGAKRTCRIIDYVFPRN